MFVHGVLPPHPEVSLGCFEEKIEGMVSRIGGEPGPLVLGTIISQWLEVSMCVKSQYCKIAESGVLANALITTVQACLE